VPIKLQIGLQGASEVERAFKQLADLGEDPEPLLKQIGQYELNETKERFYEMRGPDGQPWAPLALATILHKKQNKDRILVESQRMFNSLNWHVSRHELALGTNVEYAPVQQFGGAAFGMGKMGQTKRVVAGYKYTNRKQRKGKVVEEHERQFDRSGVPPRPFLGWSTKDRAEILRLAQWAIEKAMER